MKYFVTMASGREIEAVVSRDARGNARVTIGETTFEADAVETGGAQSIRIGSKVFDLWLEGTMPSVGVATGKLRFYAEVESERLRAISAGGRAARGAGGVVTSPMPGRVVRLLCEVGQPIEAGQAVIVVEAMKMENELVSEEAGVVTEVYVNAGDTVDGGTKLVAISGEPAP